MILVERVWIGTVGPIIEFDAEEELGRDEHGLNRQLNAALPLVAARLGRFDQVHQTLDLDLLDGPTIYLCREAREDLARLFTFRLVRRAGQDAAM